jgi:hypothetical protein
MTLSEKQRAFSKNLAKLVLWTYENGYEVSFGEVFRDPRMQKIYLREGKSKIKTSKHQLRLAADLNLFKDGVYLTKSEDYKLLGEYWKSLDPQNVWGGDWKVPVDGNHFEYAG